jgi:hypothetical protein
VCRLAFVGSARPGRRSRITSTMPTIMTAKPTRNCLAIGFTCVTDPNGQGLAAQHLVSSGGIEQ